MDIISRNGNQIIRLSDEFCVRKCNAYKLQKGALSSSAELFFHSLVHYFNPSLAEPKGAEFQATAII